MAESNGLLNRRTGNRTGGSNPPLSAIFVLVLPEKVPFGTILQIHLRKNRLF